MSQGVQKSISVPLDRCGPGKVESNVDPTRQRSEAAIFISGKESEGLFVLITNDFQYVYGRTAVLYFNKCC